MHRMCSIRMSNTRVYGNSQIVKISKLSLDNSSVDFMIFLHCASKILLDVESNIETT